MKTESTLRDTTDVHSALAFTILMEPPYKKMAETIGILWIGHEQGQIVFKAGLQSVEIGRGNTVRAAMESARLHWEQKGVDHATANESQNV